MTAERVYRQHGNGAASPLRLVVLLYEQLVKDLRNAVAAAERGDIELRTNEIDHALVVVGQLQGTLDMERGGDTAQNLDNFYNLLRFTLLAAPFTSSPEVLRKQISNLLVLREAWAQLDGLTSEAQPQPSVPLPRESNSAPARQDWKA
jgi:flagellar protein FliS